MNYKSYSHRNYSCAAWPGTPKSSRRIWKILEHETFQSPISRRQASHYSKASEANWKSNTSEREKLPSRCLTFKRLDMPVIKNDKQRERWVWIVKWNHRNLSRIIVQWLGPRDSRIDRAERNGERGEGGVLCVVSSNRDGLNYFIEQEGLEKEDERRECSKHTSKPRRSHVIMTLRFRQWSLFV